MASLIYPCFTSNSANGWDTTSWLFFLAFFFFFFFLTLYLTFLSVRGVTAASLSFCNKNKEYAERCVRSSLVFFNSTFFALAFFFLGVEGAFDFLFLTSILFSVSTLPLTFFLILPPLFFFYFFFFFVVAMLDFTASSFSIKVLVYSVISSIEGDSSSCIVECTSGSTRGAFSS